MTKIGSFTADREEAIGRLAGGIPFLANLFPEFRSLAECANALLAVLRESRAATIGIDLTDHLAIAPETFPNTLRVAVKAIKGGDTKCSLALPARRVLNPLTRKTITIKAQTITGTRAVLCHTAGFDPATDDEDIERDQLIGCLLM